MVGFLALAVLVDQLDNHAGEPANWGPVRAFLGQYAGDTQSAVGLLSAVAGSLFTVASVTFSILLLAVQQGAAALTSQVVDHYLRRMAKKVYFGFFTGTSLFVLVNLLQTARTAHPVFGVAASTFCAAASLVTLLLLVRSTIEQMRPSSRETHRRAKAWDGVATPGPSPCLLAARDARRLRVRGRGRCTLTGQPLLPRLYTGQPNALTVSGQIYWR